MAVAIKGLTDGQEGFFEASLYQASPIKGVQLDAFCGMNATELNASDACVVNARCAGTFDGPPDEALMQLKKFRGAKALFLHNAHPKVMPSDATLDQFDVVFKREPYRDRDRYAISSANKAKIVPTHLSNPFLVTSTKWKSRNRNQPLKRYAWQTPSVHDVGFLGSAGGNKVNLREETWQRVIDTGFKAFGGIYSIKGYDVPQHLVGQKLGKPAYMAEVMQTAVNLALNGHGPFTYRHLELFWAGAFTLSNGEIRDQELRAPLVENRDYVAFDNLDEMVDKIRYYLDNPKERETIARNGRAAYEVLHDTAAHAEEIKAALLT